MKSLNIIVASAMVVGVTGEAFADGEGRFAKLAADAQALGSLKAFVGKFVGECDAREPGGAECEKNTQTFRKEATGKKFSLVVTDVTSSLLQVGEVKGESGVVLNLVPFFTASGSALTHGAPSKTDTAGNPVMPFIRIDGMLPEGWSPAMMSRQTAAGALQLQVIFSPQGVWALPKKGGGSIKGVKARFEAVQITVGRTGDQVGLWLPK